MLQYLTSLPGALNLALIWAIMGIGVFITYKVLNLADLTVDGSFATGGIVCAVVISQGGNFALGLLLGFLAGLLCGLVTGLLHTLLGIPAILAGILTQLALWSINLKIAGGKANLALNARTMPVLVTQLNIYNSLWILVLILIAVCGILYWFFGTELGASIRATGNNPHMSKAQGINTKFNIVLGLMTSNGLVALSGALLAQYQGFADINMGRGAIVIGLCAVVIGTAIFSHVSSNFLVRLLSVGVGSIIYYIVYQTIVFIGLDTDLLKMLAAVIVALFLGIPYLQKTLIPKFKKWKKNRQMLKKGESL